MTPTVQAQASPPDGRVRWLKPVLFGGVLLALFAASQVVDFERGIEATRGWIQSLGAWGPLVFVGLYILATVLMVPGAIPTLMAGALFGGLWGTVYASIGSTVGAALAFLIARYLARDAVGRWLQGQAGLTRIDKLTLTHGALIVCVIRMVPLIPFNIVNYAFGLTHVRFWRYVAVSWICMLPGTFLYAAGTDVVLDSVGSGDVPWVLLASVGAALALMLVIGRRAVRRLGRVEREEGMSSAPILEQAVYEEGS